MIPTIGWARRMLPVDPWNLASPNGNTFPACPTSQYPFPDRVAAMPMIGCYRCMATVSPYDCASPNANTLPLRATSQYP